MKAGYFLRIAGRPYCDHTACMAGLDLAKRAGVDACSYGTRKSALAAAGKYNALPGYEGVATVASGRCPSLPAMAKESVQ